MSKVLFFSPPVRQGVYFSTNIKIGAPSYPNLTLATLAGNLVNDHKVKIIDLDLYKNFESILLRTIRSFNPDLVASTAKTPEYPIVRQLMKKVKEKYPSIKTIVGGVHITAFPFETADEKCFDIVAIGEGDTTIAEILSVKDLKKIPGIIYKSASGKLVVTQPRELIRDINKLPYPAWHLFDLRHYRNSRLSSRKNPVGHIETSRGCSYHCNFCNKLTFGTFYRVKDPNRVVDEMEYMLNCGFKEIHITDDSFTQNIERAKEVCREIIRRNLKFPWSLINGIRVNLVDEEFFKLAKEAGCWQSGFGIETGDRNVLKSINKQTKLFQVKKAVTLAEKAGISTFGFFIFGLSGETEKSMQKTVEFAKSLPLSTAKFDICIPFPGTRYYQELEAEGRILSRDWSKYNVHQTAEKLFEHPNLTWEKLSYYYKKGFREFYWRPSYILRRFIKSFKNGDLFYDFIYVIKAHWSFW